MKNKMILKITIAIVVIAVIAIIIYFFSRNVNKNSKMGNNLSNKTKYKIKQSYVAPNIEKQTILEPSNISGLETVYDGNTLKINNTKLNLSTVYQNYQYMIENFLWLNSFIEDYKNSSNKKLYEENNIIIMEVTLHNNNQYVSSKKLFIDKTTGKITKMIVQDKNQKNLVYILYNEIKINSLKKEEVLAFRLNNFSVAQY